MTALDVLAYLQRLRVRLTLTPELGLRYRAPRGVMTRVLIGAIKACQAEVTRLLVTGEDGEIPKGVSLSETDYSRFRTWQTDKVPVSATPMEKLKAPTYHDVPSPPETVLDVHFISSLPVRQHPACKVWADTRPVQSVWAVRSTKPDHDVVDDAFG